MLSQAVSLQKFLSTFNIYTHMKKVLVISTSLRGRSNSHELAEAFAQGAKESGNEVEECFERARYAGGVFAGSVTTPGEIKGHPSLAEAYDMGKKV